MFICTYVTYIAPFKNPMNVGLLVPQIYIAPIQERFIRGAPEQPTKTSIGVNPGRPQILGWGNLGVVASWGLHEMLLYPIMYRNTR